uniref:Cytochrome c oxidase subunit 2 n=1 Tax=Phyllodiaptomus tunguidus TaxID=2690417 RepID=A0A6G6YB63_9MAXI|nr:cytochrome c oxidase subunit II [Phyllodiaptomus tunguidus]QIG86764.1 cytochrome c oxidase subunit II [Phyllodiaptomus tunguidus]UDF84352.1 cytochrome c oxidase subunit II [Phyllodiaptomus tunguidus]UDF84365.1 cytochrome c oxidase subunit II [Phyllodiaptomus tunguidus]UDF84378.1 cytochrome c oxidase subunit II [Phyllodiaptomus tunguidus]UDF84391.1 cytochrome c oxidase subunit II [Phyllodiaptomus tunguidus]
MMTWGQFGLQDGNSPIMEELIFLHDFINLVLMFIISFVGYMMISMMKNSFINKNLLEMQMVESIWTIIPAVILVQIALPSLLLLYMLDESIDSSLTLKAIGHQWYWSYEYSDFWFAEKNSFYEFDAYMIPSAELSPEMFRLLDTDNHTVLPFNTHVRVLISSADVLHAWTVPSLGVKADAVPGRINQVKFISQRPGIFYGQCSEICGANHSFMPIVLESISGEAFINWIANVE